MGARKNAGGPAPDQLRTSSGSIIRGVWAPPKLLAEAKSDENERTKTESSGSNTPWAYRPGEYAKVQVCPIPKFWRKAAVNHKFWVQRFVCDTKLWSYVAGRGGACPHPPNPPMTQNECFTQGCLGGKLPAPSLLLHLPLLCHTADVSAVGQQTCLVCRTRDTPAVPHSGHTADTSAVCHSRHVCCVKTLIYLLRDRGAPDNVCCVDQQTLSGRKGRVLDKAANEKVHIFLYMYLYVCSHIYIYIHMYIYMYIYVEKIAELLGTGALEHSGVLHGVTRGSEMPPQSLGACKNAQGR